MVDSRNGVLGYGEAIASCPPVMGLWERCKPPSGVRGGAPPRPLDVSCILEAPDGLSWNLLRAKFGDMAPLAPSSLILLYAPILETLSGKIGVDRGHHGVGGGHAPLRRSVESMVVVVVVIVVVQFFAVYYRHAQ